ncbi:MAG TPA: EF-hand domain-containing protein [Sphingopyxis sp.]|nr:EF-hand domain-containing protein [Sphingopyxis sp.]
MLKPMIFMAALAFAMPAAAQVSDPQSPATPPMEQNKPVNETESVPAAPSAGRPATADQVRSIVDQEFPSHDKDANGSLDAAEFAAWIGQLRAASPQPQPVSDPTAWNEAAFKAADADASGQVSKDELVAFLSRAR